ncbi:hypothetical protein F4777DRAFT_569347 [Nemania sp. FL0916]|nr:hypothetical protein F4777DRAFT_569347 [Nemania sp. FL0916]
MFPTRPQPKKPIPPSLSTSDLPIPPLNFDMETFENTLFENDVFSSYNESFWILEALESERNVKDTASWSLNGLGGSGGEYDHHQKCPTPVNSAWTGNTCRNTPIPAHSNYPPTPESLSCISPTASVVENAFAKSNVAHQYQLPPVDPLPVHQTSDLTPMDPVPNFQLPTSSDAEPLATTDQDTRDDSVTVPESSQKSLRKKRRKNRFAVARSRQKKDKKVSDITERADGLCVENMALKDQRRLLRNEILDLKTRILSYHGCHNCPITQYIDSCARVISQPLPSISYG